MNDIKKLPIVLKEIDDIIEAYEGGQYRGLNEAHRKLSTNMYWLVKHQVRYNNKWNVAYHNYKELEGKTSSAAKERHADKEVPQLYACRKIWEAAKNVSISIGYEVKAD